MLNTSVISNTLFILDNKNANITIVSRFKNKSINLSQIFGVNFNTRLLNTNIICIDIPFLPVIVLSKDYFMSTAANLLFTVH